MVSSTISRSFQTVILDYTSHYCDLHLELLKITHHSFCMSLWPMMMYHHTKFGYERFSSSGILTAQTFNDILNLHCDLDLECSNPFFKN